MHAIAIFVGGGLGSLCRYSLSYFNKSTSTLLPFGTIAANVLACIVLGFVVGLVSSRTHINPNVRDLFTIGFCGGFSTFSTFSLETFGLLQKGAYGYAFANVGLSLVLCLGGIALGFFLEKWWTG